MSVTELSRRSMLMGAAAISCTQRDSGAPKTAAALESANRLGAVLVTPAQRKPELDLAIADALQALRDLTGAPFRSTTKPEPRGIFLVLTADPHASPDDVRRLKDHGPEAFILRSEGPERITIAANRDAGLKHGLYHYLRRIGCHWLAPNPRWRVLAPSSSIALNVDELVRPAFKLRSFFGTGGLAGRSPVDPDLKLRDAWDDWTRRNGFGGEIAFAGHSFDSFNLRNRAVLEAHPEYRALVGGERQPWAKATKLCVSNRDVVDLFTRDRVQALEAAIRADPEAPTSFAVSVEPSDGPGFCECENCKAIGNGSPSDQSFYLANQVAKTVRSLHPGRFVSLYAYSSHAQPPSFPLEENVYVMVVPDAYQRSGLPGDALVALWHQHLQRLACRGYWNLPDWKNDLPSFDFTSAPFDTARRWHAQGVEGLLLETSFSAGAMGPGLYMLGRALWDPGVQASQVVADYYDLAFGPARPAMQRLMSRWISSFTPTGYELGSSYRDLAAARQAAQGRQDVLARISDYEKYLHYVRLWIEYKRETEAGEARSGAADRIVGWLYRIYDSAMVSPRMIQLMKNKHERGSTTLKDAFDPANAKAEGWRKITPLTDAELAQCMREGARLYPAPSDLAAPRRYTAELRRPRIQAKPLPANAEFLPPIRLSGPTPVELEVPPGQSELRFGLTVKRDPYAGGDEVALETPDGARVFQTRIEADGEPHEISVPIPKPGRYRLKIHDQKATFELRLPASVPATFSNLACVGVAPRLYFYVPATLKRLVMYAPSTNPIVVHDPEGRPTKYDTRDQLLTVDLSPEQRGKIWSVSGYQSRQPLRLLNAPQALALSPTTLLTPSDAD